MVIGFYNECEGVGELGNGCLLVGSFALAVFVVNAYKDALLAKIPEKKTKNITISLRPSFPKSCLLKVEKICIYKKEKVIFGKQPTPNFFSSSIINSPCTPCLQNKKSKPLKIP